MSRTSRRIRRSFRRGVNRLGETRYDLGDRTPSSKFLRQVVISLVLLALVLAIKELPAGLSQNAENIVRWVVTEETDFVGALRRLPTVETLARGEKPFLPFLLPFIGKEEEIEPQEMIWPLEGRIASGFGWRTDPETTKEHFHEGVDMEAPLGTPVKVVLDGRVSEIIDSPIFGHMVVVDHGKGLGTAYAHLSEVLVRSPQPLTQGEIIGRVGQSGNALSPHLHFEVREEGVPVDPSGYLGMGEPVP